MRQSFNDQDSNFSFLFFDDENDQTSPFIKTYYSSDEYLKITSLSPEYGQYTFILLQNASNSLTLPTIEEDTLVGRNTVDILRNKTLINASANEFTSERLLVDTITHGSDSNQITIDSKIVMGQILMANHGLTVQGGNVVDNLISDSIQTKTIGSADDVNFVGITSQLQVGGKLSANGGIYFLMKVKAVFDKVGGLLNTAYGGLQSIMDTVNVVLVLPEMVMQILGFFVLLFTLIVALLIIMFTVNYGLGISFTAIGASLLWNPFTAAVGAVWIAMGSVLIKYIAIGIYLVAIIITTVFLGLILSIYIPVKKHFEAAGRSSYCCFSSDTPVKLDSGDYQPISSIGLGQDVAGGGAVHGILFTKMPQVEKEDWVKVKGVRSEKESCLVYKTHKLFLWPNSPPFPVGEFKDKEANTMVQIHSLSEEDVHRLKNKEKWCLVTTNHRIESIDGIVFTDYQEVIEKSNEMELLASRILKKFNPLCSKNIQKEFEYGEMNFGFTGETLVLLEEKAVKQIQDIKVGDILQGSNEVIGIYICTPQETYQPCVVHGVQVPPQQILSTTTADWIKAYMSSEKEVKSTYSTSNLLYHLVTSSGDYKLLSTSSAATCAS